MNILQPHQLNGKTGKDTVTKDDDKTSEELKKLLYDFRTSWIGQDTKKIVSCFSIRRVYLYHPAFSRNAGYFSRQQLNLIFDDHFRKVKTVHLKFIKFHTRNSSAGRGAAEIDYKYETKEGKVEHSLIILFLRKEKEQWFIHKFQLLGNPAKK
jgi:hypothetical protein